MNYLREKDILLVLDNLEHLLEGDSAGPGVTACTGVVLLVTSREQLNLQEEWVCDVAGLHYPTDVVTEDVDGCSAIELFHQSARRARDDFVLEEVDVSCVVRVYQLVEGMPLAIELAAAGTAVVLFARYCPGDRTQS